MGRPTWREEGREPDYRFSLANERTFLAWIRTALALLAGGVALPEFVAAPRLPWIVPSLAAVLVAAAAVLAVEAYRHWRANQIAMRLDHPLPGTIALPLLTVLSGGLGCGILVILLLR